MRSTLTILLIFSIGLIFSQGTTCANADPFCTGTTEFFPNTTGVPSAENGPDYDCLFSTPNPAWYFMQVGIAGNINLTITQTATGGGGLDVDFACWGPFMDLNDACTQLTGVNVVDCSYSTASVETCVIPNGQVGEFYILVITNYSDDPGNITFDQTGGTGSTNCDILNPCIADAGPDQTICSGESVQIGGNPSAVGGDSMFNYSWSSAGSLDNGTASNPIASPTTTTTYTLTIADASGCSAEDEVTITVDTPIADPGPAMTLDCSVSEVTLDGSASSAGSYTWTTADGSIVSGANTSNPLVSQPGTYELTVESADGCTSTASVSVSLAADIEVDATMTGDDQICEGETTDISIDLDQVGKYEIIYSIDGVPQPLVSIVGDSYTITTGTAALYQLVAISNDVCNVNTSGIVNLNVEPLPTLSFPNLDEFLCPGTTLSTEVTLTGEGDLTFQYGIDGNPEPAISTSAGVFEITIDQSGNYAPISISSANCTGTVAGDFNVIDVPEPTATFVSDYTICEDEVAVVDILLTGNAPYEIAYALDGTLLATETSNTDVLTFNIDEAGLLEIVSLSDFYCTGSSSSTSTISVDPLPQASISGGGLFCANDLPALSIDLNGTGPFSLTYTIDGQQATIIDTAVTTFDLPTTTDGVYEIIFIADALCDDGIQGSTEVNLYPPITLNVDHPSAICDGDTLLLQAEASGGQAMGYTYTWIDMQGMTSDGESLLTSSTEDIQIQAIANDGCEIPSDTLDIQIDVQDYPVPSIIASIDSICIGESVTFIRDSIDSSVDCLWTFQDGSVGFGCEGVDQLFFEDGHQSVTLSTSTSAGCESSITVDSLVYVVPDPVADFEFVPMEGTIFSPEVQLIDLSENSVALEWDLGDGTFSEDSLFIHMYPGAIADAYITCLTAYNELGCSDTTCQVIRIESEFLMSIPNAFTPDDDDLNERIRPIFNDIVLEEYSFQIFDRFGRIVFESNDPEEWWNGQGADDESYYSGNGIYSYYLTVREANKSEKREFHGTITLIR